jgi:hypothetical protein
MGCRRSDGVAAASADHGWVLLFGLVPVDRHAYGTLEYEEAAGIVETSSSVINRVWKHQRTSAPIEGGCELVDRLEFLPRVPAMAFILKPAYLCVFRHRHAYLRSRYAAPGG